MRCQPCHWARANKRRCSLVPGTNRNSGQGDTAVACRRISSFARRHLSCRIGHWLTASRSVNNATSPSALHGLIHTVAATTAVSPFIRWRVGGCSTTSSSLFSASPSSSRIRSLNSGDRCLRVVYACVHSFATTSASASASASASISTPVIRFDLSDHRKQNSTESPRCARSPSSRCCAQSSPPPRLKARPTPR